MKKYLVFGISEQMGGVESFLFNYVGKMMNDENRFEFIFFDTVPDFFHESVLKNCKYYVVTSRTRNYLKYIQGLDKILKDGKYDVLWYNVCTLSDITLLKLAKKQNIPCRIVHGHNSENMGGKLVGVLHWLHKKEVMLYSTENFACSDKAAEFMFGTKNGVEIVNNAIEVSKYKYNETVRNKVRNELNITDELVIGHVGRFHTEKNHVFIIKVLKQIVQLNNSVKLILIGDGSLKKRIISYAKEKGVFENIIFLEKRTDVNELLQAMDVFLFPSLFEGLGLALIEAQAADLPCVISNTIPDAAILTEKVVIKSLNDSPADWAKTLLNCGKDKARKDRELLLRQKGYDIQDNADMLIKYINEKY